LDKKMKVNFHPMGFCAEGFNKNKQLSAQIPEKGMKKL